MTSSLHYHTIRDCIHGYEMSAFIGLSEHYERVSADRLAQASFAALAVLIVSNWLIMPLFSSSPRTRRKERFNPRGKVSRTWLSCDRGEPS